MARMQQSSNAIVKHEPRIMSNTFVKPAEQDPESASQLLEKDKSEEKASQELTTEKEDLRSCDEDPYDAFDLHLVYRTHT